MGRTWQGSRHGRESGGESEGHGARFREWEEKGKAVAAEVREGRSPSAREQPPSTVTCSAHSLFTMHTHTHTTMTNNKANDPPRPLPPPKHN